MSQPTLPPPGFEELSADELYRWTKRYGKTRKGVAVEQAQVVCRALGELLQPPELERLKRHLPEIAPLLEVPEPGDPPSAPSQKLSDGTKTRDEFEKLSKRDRLAFMNNGGRLVDG